MKQKTRETIAAALATISNALKDVENTPDLQPAKHPDALDTKIMKCLKSGTKLLSHRFNNGKEIVTRLVLCECLEKTFTVSEFKSYNHCHYSDYGCEAYKTEGMEDLWNSAYLTIAD